jgi:hypothetical protein
MFEGFDPSGLLFSDPDLARRMFAKGAFSRTVRR